MTDDDRLLTPARRGDDVDRPVAVAQHVETGPRDLAEDVDVDDGARPGGLGVR